VRSAQGAAAVEFALVVPILVMLLLGMVSAGLTYSRGITLADAVREGARLGATADATIPATWAADVISRTRSSQYDDGTPATAATAICVQLWKGTAAAGSAVASSCSQANYGTPALSAADLPSVPSTVTATTCVVRVVAARRYTITLGVLPDYNGTLKRGSVARYERSTC
jgi:Flp pilus assembly protein TadG